MNTSDSIKEIAGALAKAQGVMAGAKKDATNPHFKSKYADLASVWDACRPALTANGIAVVQMNEPSDKDEIRVTTRLCHLSGEWMEGTIAVPVSKADAQGYGSAMTYARRYGLSAAVGIAPEDDDGNAAAAAPAMKHLPNDEGVAVLAKMTPEEKDFIHSHANQLKRLFSNGELHAMVEYVQAQKLDSEEIMALWSLLPSPLRTSFKKAKAEMTSPLAV